MKMIQTILRKNVLLLSFAVAFGASLVGCSSSEKTEEEGDVAATADETATAEPAAPPAAAEPAAPPATAPMTGGSVLYVKVNKAEVKEQPNAGARTVGQLQKGDHIYVQVEGAWAKFGDNKYVSTSALTEQGVGRSRRKASWVKGN